jgi:DNA-directed RNA polymerase
MDNSKTIMKRKIIESLRVRSQTEFSTHKNPLKYLENVNFEEHIDSIIANVYLYTRNTGSMKNSAIYFSDIISALGHSLRGKLKLKRDSSVAAKTGAFILYTFENLGLIEVLLGKGRNGHNAYIVQIKNDREICKLWSTIEPRQIDKLPSIEPYAPWDSYRHPTGTIIVKTQHKGVLETIHPDKTPMLFECLNKAQKVGWNINNNLLQTAQWALRNRASAFDDIWLQPEKQAFDTKLREANSIIDIAERFTDRTFYHLYYFDFRGRKYPTTAYLHEQGSDLARSLLLRAEGKSLTSAGFFWLCVSMASNYAGDAGRKDNAKTDKIPLDHRYKWVIDNEEILLSYAKNPKVHQGWMSADKPWQFLAGCIELNRLRSWQSLGGTVDDFVTGLEVYIDGTNNGCQHLSALTLDEITAPYVNLVFCELPGDLYAYVAEKVWESISREIKGYHPTVLEDCETFIDNLIHLKTNMLDAPQKSAYRNQLMQELKDYKHENDVFMDICAPVFWNRITDLKERRKIVKRNTMTLPYGGTAYGLGQQIIDDAKKHNIPLLRFLEHKWGAWLGRQVLEICKEAMERPMRLLSIFENAGKAAEYEEKFLSWTVPVTSFPVVQHYIEGPVKKIWIQYGPPIGERKNTNYFENTLQVAICFIEKPVPSKGKQSQGAAPNIIHSLDAAHLVYTTVKADFPVTTIHDSFGALPCDMPALYKIIRETFVELYEKDPLTSILSDIGASHVVVQKGKLKLESVIESEYCFS